MVSQYPCACKIGEAKKKLCWLNFNPLKTTGTLANNENQMKCHISYGSAAFYIVLHCLLRERNTVLFGNHKL